MKTLLDQSVLEKPPGVFSGKSSITLQEFCVETAITIQGLHCFYFFTVTPNMLSVMVRLSELDPRLEIMKVLAQTLGGFSKLL